MATCSVSGCDTDVARKGLCRNHLHQEYRKGDANNPCRVKDCSGGCYGRFDVCYRHYVRMRRYGDTSISHKRLGEKGCSMPDCQRPYWSDGLCSMHLERMRHRALRYYVVTEILGGKCVHCGFSDPRALQVDHINGNGNKEYKSIGAGAIYRKIAKIGPKGYQLLCANCNWIKRAEKKETSVGDPY